MSDKIEPIAFLCKNKIIAGKKWYISNDPDLLGMVSKETLITPLYSAEQMKIKSEQTADKMIDVINTIWKAAHGNEPLFKDSTIEFIKQETIK